METPESAPEVELPAEVDDPAAAEPDHDDRDVEVDRGETD